MVLQRGKPVNIWGWADKGESVTVSFAGQTAKAIAGDDGKWSTSLASMKANAEGQSMTITGSNTITLENILIGEVWLCSGQSNMRWKLAQSQHFKEEAPKAKYPNIRLFLVKEKVSPTPLENVPSAWEACTPATATEFSGVGYHFGQRLHTELNVPIGLLQAAWGGTEIEPWTPASAFDAFPSLKSHGDAAKALVAGAKVRADTPSAIYNGMVHAMAPFSLSGAIWYQGESNCLKGDTDIYTDKTHAMISGWRDVFKQEEMSFYFVQIAPFQYKQSFIKRNKNLTEESLPRFWDASAECMTRIPKCGMVVITDITGNVNNIHPGNKRDVGKRLAGWALAKDYGKTEMVYSGPQYKSMKIEGPKVVLDFDHVGGGLKSLDGNDLTHFFIAGADKKFVPAKATIKGDAVELTSDVSTPVAVRFGWHETALPNFGNAAGLPGIQFRTDDW